MSNVREVSCDSSQPAYTRACAGKSCVAAKQVKFETCLLFNVIVMFALMVDRLQSNSHPKARISAPDWDRCCSSIEPRALPQEPEHPSGLDYQKLEERTVKTKVEETCLRLQTLEGHSLPPFSQPEPDVRRVLAWTIFLLKAPGPCQVPAVHSWEGTISLSLELRTAL